MSLRSKAMSSKNEVALGRLAAPRIINITPTDWCSPPLGEVAHPQEGSGQEEVPYAELNVVEKFVPIAFQFVYVVIGFRVIWP